MVEDKKHSIDKGLITGIQRFSLHDGPGIRTVVFFKGCPLRCFWCHNPETWAMKSELLFYQARCFNCGLCVDTCPEKAHSMQQEEHKFDRSLCKACGLCIDNCPAKALEITGELWDADTLVDELIKDKNYYTNSKGGVTLSGGEPVSQADFVVTVLKKLKKHGINRAVETSGFCEKETLKKIIPHLDLVIMDIKHIDDNKHKKYTGQSNEQILDNALFLSKTDIPLIIRTPIIPDFNDNIKDIGKIADYIKSFDNLQYYELIGFHNYSENKFCSLDINFETKNIIPPSRDKLEELANAAEMKGVGNIVIGS